MTSIQLDDDAFWEGAHGAARSRYKGLAYAGKGAYSVVARAYDSKAREYVAVKRVGDVFYDASEAKKVLREIRLLRDFCHPHVISLRALLNPASMEDFDTIFVVQEWMAGDLRQRIKSGAAMPARTVQLYLAQLLSAMAHVHGVGAIHRDCKPANILLSRDGKTLKLADFGLARTAAAESRGTERAGEEHERPGVGEPCGDARQPPPLKRAMTQYVVTRWYRAPEVILQEPYSCAIDVWSVGCIFKELLELQPSSAAKTGALFPGRYCIPFSFDDDTQQRQRHDQLNVIFRVLGQPTKPELAWATRESRREVKELCGGWDRRASGLREVQRKSLLSRACGAASEAELDLLAALLRLQPHARPSAAAALREHPYFASLPPEQQPPLTPAVAEVEVSTSFAFEAEDLNANDLRILIANDIFRMRHAAAGAESPIAKAEAAEEQSPPEQARLRELEPTHTRCNT